jgi:hypothetical protein
MLEIAAKVVLTPFVVAILAVVFASVWGVFKKAGRSGWALLVPIYNCVAFFQIAGKSGWWTLLLLIPGVNMVACILACIGLAERFGRGTRFGLGLFFLAPLFFPLLAFSNLRYRKQD